MRRNFPSHGESAHLPLSFLLHSLLVWFDTRDISYFQVFGSVYLKLIFMISWVVVQWYLELCSSFQHSPETYFLNQDPKDVETPVLLLLLVHNKQSARF